VLAALLMISGTLVTDLLGILLGVVLGAWQWRWHPRRAAATPPP